MSEWIVSLKVRPGDLAGSSSAVPPVEELNTDDPEAILRYDPVVAEIEGFLTSSSLGSAPLYPGDVNESVRFDPYQYIETQPLLDAKGEVSVKTSNPYQSQSLRDVKKSHDQWLRERSWKMTLAQWPSQTDVLCWWCCHSFVTSPIGIPEKVRTEYEERPEHFEVWGNFCSFECAYAFLIQEKGEAKAESHYSDLVFLHSRLTGTKYAGEHREKRFQIAPSRYLLKAFGGPLSIEEFRNASGSETQYRLLKPPMIALKQDLEKTERTKQVQNARDLIKRKKAKTTTIENLLSGLCVSST